MVFLFGEAHEHCTTVSERGDNRREPIATSADNGEVRLHLPAGFGLEAHHRIEPFGLERREVCLQLADAALVAC